MKNPSARLLPDRLYIGELLNYTIGHVTFDSDVHGEGERLLRFVLPPFQRPPVWTRAQKVKFMESVVLGLPLGTYCYSQSHRNQKTDGWLIDGQQRIRAVADFIKDAFPVFGYRWSELGQVDRIGIEMMIFPAYVLKERNEKELLERYIVLNYSGTAHTASDKRRAQRMRKELTP